jgi:hypothetical protein
VCVRTQCQTPCPTKVRVCDSLCDPKVWCECPSEYVVVCVYVCVCMRVCICVCCANECGVRTCAQPFHLILLHVLCGGRMFEFPTTIDNSIYARYLNPPICSYFLSLTHIHAHNTHTRLHTYTHIHIHTHTHILTRTHTHTHTHIYTHTHSQS